MANKLSREKSPYLLQHKDNPVNWYPWCEEAFRKAAEEEKPIFLSIGYSTCHWCHVMAQESFEDEKTAILLESFVCIKVDREERPDIDAVYMNVCQALTGSGGWPLTIFLTPSGKPFFAGTYIPKKSRYGQPGLQDLLWQITLMWKSNREPLLQSSEQITAAIQRSRTASDKPVPDRSLLQKGYRMLCQNFESAFGGFGLAPKFPTPHNLLFLMRIYTAEKKPEALQMAERTLQAMAAGGIFDHIGGGFSRYSTDEKWLTPHFEKMLYDNALLLLAYVEAFQITQNSHYQNIAKRTADYMLRELADPQGGFYCGQDADSDGREGSYYVFTPEEVQRVLGKEDGAQFCQLYHITPDGNFEGKSIPNRIQMEGEGWSDEDPRILKLWNYRKERSQLPLDHKILFSWNAWAILALLKAGHVLDEPRYRDAALKAYAFLKSSMIGENGRPYLRFCDGEAALAGQLEDYAVFALALTELYHTTFEIHYLTEAVQYANLMIDLFEDKENGGFYMTAHDAEALIFRPKEIYDGAMPSGNSVSAMVLERLAGLTGTSFFREAADRQFSFLAGQIKDHPDGYCYALLALSLNLYPHKELLFTGRQIPDEVQHYGKTHPSHDISILYKSAENQKELAALAPFTKHYPVTDSSVFYLCENGACHAPESDFSRLGL